MSLSKAITEAYPGVQGIIIEDGYNIIEWPSNIPKPTKGELQALEQAWLVANQYRILRQKAYPPVVDQLDMLQKDMKNGTTVWVNTIQVIKDQYPKP